MMGILSHLQPEAVFQYFEEICRIPHGSGNVEQISDYLVEFARKRNLRYRQDEFYNVVIFKEASEGYENHEPVILQGHMDMVCVKNSGCSKDMDTEGLDLVVEGDYVKAVDTTLGGDDGIAVAYALALLDDENIVHPPLEVMITVDEEIGMLGASAIDLSDFRGHVMLNLDSEEEGIFISGCAGGAAATCHVAVTKECIEGSLINIHISGLESGHSGEDIIYQRANANVLMGRILFMLSQEVNMRIVHICGGEKDNSIAPYSKVSILVEQEDVQQAISLIEHTTSILKQEYQVTDPRMKVDCAIEEYGQRESFDAETTSKLVLALTHIQDGVVKMSNDIPGLVQTSLNLGIVKEEENEVQLTYLVRSSVTSERDYLVAKIVNFSDVLGCECTLAGVYPAWEYKRDSRLCGIMSDAYEKIYGNRPEVRTMHAGVECGILAEKIDGLDCISFGPEILDIHTPKERLGIQSVERTWRLILEVLRNL